MSSCFTVHLLQKFKDSCYVFRRIDIDITILNTKYLDELRNTDMEGLNSTHANIHVSYSQHHTINFSLSQFPERARGLYQPGRDKGQL